MLVQPSLMLLSSLFPVILKTLPTALGSPLAITSSLASLIYLAPVVMMFLFSCSPSPAPAPTPAVRISLHSSSLIGSSIAPAPVLLPTALGSPITPSLALVSFLLLLLA